MMWSAVGLQTQPPAQSRLSCGVRHGGSGLWATGVRTPPRPEMVQAFQVACPSVQYPDMEIPETCFLQLKTLLFLLMATVAQKPQPPVTSLQAEQTPQKPPSTSSSITKSLPSLQQLLQIWFLNATGCNATDDCSIQNRAMWCSHVWMVILFCCDCHFPVLSALSIIPIF